MSKDILSMYLKGSTLTHLSKESRSLIAIILSELQTRFAQDSTLSIPDAMHIIADVVLDAEKRTA